jgi:hypothetical protein
VRASCHCAPGAAASSQRRGEVQRPIVTERPGGRECAWLLSRRVAVRRWNSGAYRAQGVERSRIAPGHRLALRLTQDCTIVRIYASKQCPRQDSNLRSRLRRPLLSPLSYGGSGLRKVTSPDRMPGLQARRGTGTPVWTSGGDVRPAIPDRTSAFLARSVAGSAGKTLPSRPWRRDWDACSWWTTMR